MTSAPSVRKGRHKLFIPYKHSSSKEIKRATVSSWLVKVMQLDYESQGPDLRALKLIKVSSIEMRAFKGMSVDIRGGLHLEN